jgi:hypothetical protein
MITSFKVFEVSGALWPNTVLLKASNEHVKILLITGYWFWL